MNNTIEIKGNLEVRWTHNSTSSMRYPEIVKWKDKTVFSEEKRGLVCEEHCYTLAYWIRDDVHWDLKFVGNRPFAITINWREAWSMMKKTQTMLDDLEQEEEEDDYGKWKQELTEMVIREMGEDNIRKIVRDEIQISKSNENKPF